MKNTRSMDDHLDHIKTKLACGRGVVSAVGVVGGGWDHATTLSKGH